MFRDFTSELSTNLIDCFRGRNLLWHAAAIGLTFLLVTTGFDWWFYEVTRSPLFYWFVRFAGIGGFFLPVLVSIALYAVGEMRQNRRMQHTARAVAQAIIIASLIAAAYKSFTGRVEPPFAFVGTIDNSHEFNWGFLEYGIFWGWPSSHATVAFAGTAAFAYMNRNKALRMIALFYAIVIGSAAAIGFHWLSDVVAGMLLGIMIGTTVARYAERPSAPEIRTS